MRKQAKADELFFSILPDRDTSGHGRHRYHVDLRNLRDGYPGRRQNAGFRGNPEIAAKIGAGARKYLEMRRPGPHTARSLTKSLYKFARFLDQKAIQNTNKPIQITRSLLVEFADYLENNKIGEAHRTYCHIKALVQIAVPTIRVPQNRFVQRNATSAISDQSLGGRKDEGAVIAKAAMTDFLWVDKRIADAKTLAAQGSNPVLLMNDIAAEGRSATNDELNRTWTLKNTLRLMADLHYEPISAADFDKLSGVRSDRLCFPAEARSPIGPESARSMRSGVGVTLRWVLPAIPDLLGPFMLCGEILGWNASTILNLKSSTVLAVREKASQSDGSVEIWSVKGRSRSLQRRPLSAGKRGLLAILVTVNDWTQPLRNALIKERQSIHSTLCDPTIDPEMRGHLEARLDWLEDRVDRLWLALTTKKVGITSLSMHHLSARAFRALLDDHCVQAGIQFATRKSRLSFADRIQAAGDFETTFMQALLGHRRASTTRGYEAQLSRDLAIKKETNLVSEAIVASVRKSGRIEHRQVLAKLRSSTC